MYVWVVLATFLAILASYTLPVRPDSYQLESQPLAEAELNKLSVKHIAATKYARGKLSVTGSNVYSKNYSANEVTEQNANLYYGEGFVWDNGYTSQIFCLDEAGGYLDECSGSMKDYVVTYGQLPDKWVNHKTGYPNGEFKRVIAKAFAKKKDCGLIVDDDGCGGENGSGYSVYSYYELSDDEEEENSCLPTAMNTLITTLIDGGLINRTVICITKIVEIENTGS